MIVVFLSFLYLIQRHRNCWRFKLQDGVNFWGSLSSFAWNIPLWSAIQNTQSLQSTKVLRKIAALIYAKEN